MSSKLVSIRATRAVAAVGIEVLTTSDGPMNIDMLVSKVAEQRLRDGTGSADNMPNLEWPDLGSIDADSSDRVGQFRICITIRNCAELAKIQTNY